jgi:NAD(P)-dependent dehydrogenase (short-subunit alcohol dehydrogenase family)
MAVALVTGASSDIGAAAARAFARDGYKVVLAARRRSVLQRLAEEIKSEGGDALPVETDVTQASDVDDLLEAVRAAYGGLDVAFNNAGGSTPPTPLAQLDASAFDRALRLNAFGTFLCMKAEIEAMLARGSGAIVNMSSTAGLQGVAGLASYCAGKHAVIGMSKAAALDYADKDIRVNVVAPGPIATERIPHEHRSRIAQYLPLKRIGEPQDVAELVRWLCSSEARFITGAVIPIDGGKLAGTPSFAASK